MKSPATSFAVSALIETRKFPSEVVYGDGVVSGRLNGGVAGVMICGPGKNTWFAEPGLSLRSTTPARPKPGLRRAQAAPIIHAQRNKPTPTVVAMSPS